MNTYIGYSNVCHDGAQIQKLSIRCQSAKLLIYFECVCIHILHEEYRC